MTSFKYVITDPVGIHARPAGALVKEIKKYDSDVKVLANGKSADGIPDWTRTYEPEENNT